MNLQKLEETMMKTRMKKLLAGMCAVLILPIGSAQTVLAEEPEQNFPISVEKAVNQTLKLWYGSPAKINTAESSGGEWMQQSLPLGNGIGRLDSLLQSLLGEWEGSASEAYRERYESLRPAFTQAEELLAEISKALNTTAQNMENVDESIASGFRG